MEYASVLKRLEQETKDQPWSSLKLPLAFDDRPFRDQANAKQFIRHSVAFGEGEPTSLGATCYRYVGIQYLSIFFAQGEGNASMWSLADAMVRHFSDQHFDNIVFDTASAFKRPADSKGLAQIQVVCPFYFDTVRS